MIRYFLLLLAVVSTSVSYSQTKFKPGKVTVEDLTMKECSYYPEADAMVLGQTGTLTFFYTEETHWFYEIDIVKRIKILKTDGKDHANISIVLYDPVRSQTREEYSHQRATTFNLDQGKVVKTKLARDQIFKKRLSNFRQKITFTMPDVQEGSVIEYKYKIRSDYISNLYNWHFQEDIPVLYSEFKYQIPEYFNYRESIQGSMLNIDRKKEEVIEDFEFRQEATPENRGNEEKGLFSVQSTSTLTTLTASNVLPLEDEPFMNNRPNLPSRIEFQLMSYESPSGEFQSVAYSYDTFTKELLSRSDFGGAIQKGGFAKQFISGLEESEERKAQDIYYWLRDHFSFDGVISIASSKAGKKAFNDAKGSVSDINLSMVAAWRQAGLVAYPVILSTRGHGIPHPTYPNYEDFNYVIGAVLVGEEVYLCDASSSFGFGQLPTACLNGKGWLVRQEGGLWVNLKQNAKGSITVSSTYQVGDEIVAKHQSKYAGYDALKEKAFLFSNGEESYKDRLATAFEEGEVDNVQVNDSPESLKWAVDCSIDLEDGEMVYLKPIQTGTVLENSFRREERASPIDFPYAVQRRVIVQVQLADGFEVVELPQPAVVSLPDNAGQFSYSISQNGSTISISSVFSLKKPDYSTDEYPYLRQFFQMAADKNNELIVLKRI